MGNLIHTNLENPFRFIRFWDDSPFIGLPFDGAPQCSLGFGNETSAPALGLEHSGCGRYAGPGRVHQPRRLGSGGLVAGPPPLGLPWPGGGGRGDLAGPAGPVGPAGQPEC